MALTAAIIAGVGTVAGGVMNARGIAQETEAEVARARYQAQVAKNYAKFAIEEGQAEESKLRMENNAVLAQQRTGLAASGVEVNSGSAMDVQVSGKMIGELDALTIRQNAQMRAASHLDQAKLGYAEAENAKKAGSLAQWSNIIGTATSVASKWAKT